MNFKYLHYEITITYENITIKNKNTSEIDKISKEKLIIYYNRMTTYQRYFNGIRTDLIRNIIEEILPIFEMMNANNFSYTTNSCKKMYKKGENIYGVV